MLEMGINQICRTIFLSGLFWDICAGLLGRHFLSVHVGRDTD